MLDNAQLSLVEVQGHTDTVGRAQDNLTLSASRARAVMAYLVNAGVSDQRLTAKGMGEDVPIEVEDTEEARALNRRVEFHVQETSAHERITLAPEPGCRTRLKSIQKLTDVVDFFS